MPNTLDLIAKRGMTFNRYYVSYPLCCPSRVSLLTGRYAHNHGVKGNIQPNGGYTGFAQRAAMTHNLAVWLQNGGYKTIHIGKFLNGYGDKPYDDGKTVPPGWSSWHTILNADTNHYYYGYLMNNNGTIEGPYGDSGSWDTREYGARDDIGCPFAPTNGLPCYYETDHLTELATHEIAETPAEQPFYLQLDYTAPHGDFRRPAGPRAGAAPLRLVQGRPPPPRPLGRLRRGQRQRQAPLHPRSRPPDPQRQAHLPRLLAEAARGPALGRRRRETDHRHARRGQPPAQHLHPLHLRQRLLLRRAPPDRRQVPRLRAGHPPALPDPRAGDQAGHLDRRARLADRHRADRPRTGRGDRRQEHRRALDGPVPPRPEPAHPTARCSSSPSSKPATSSRAAAPKRPPPTNPRPNSGDAALARPSSGGGGATASILAPPKDYEGIRLGPYKYIAWPSGEKELYDINKDPNELNNLVKIPNYFPIRNYLHTLLTGGVDEEGGLEDCVGRTCQEPAAKIPLNRIELRRVRKQEKEEKLQERREKREQREQERKEKEQKEKGKHGH